MDATTGEVVNQGRLIEIGDEVWVGHDVTVLKNTLIGSHSVVGGCSVVAGRFAEERVAIAGSSARVIKRNVQWRKASVNWHLDHGESAEAKP